VSPEILEMVMPPPLLLSPSIDKFLYTPLISYNFKILRCRTNIAYQKSNRVTHKG